MEETSACIQKLNCVSLDVYTVNTNSSNPLSLSLYLHYSADSPHHSLLWASEEEIATNIGGVDHTDQFR